MQKYNENIKGEDLHAILDEIDTNQNGQVELDEYLQVNWFIILISERLKLNPIKLHTCSNSQNNHKINTLHFVRYFISKI